MWNKTYDKTLFHFNSLFQKEASALFQFAIYQFYAEKLTASKMNNDQTLFEKMPTDMQDEFSKFRTRLQDLLCDLSTGSTLADSQVRAVCEHWLSETHNDVITQLLQYPDQSMLFLDLYLQNVKTSTQYFRHHLN